MDEAAGKLPRVRTVTATRYVTPLREGGSLPAIVEADDDGLYVLKFRGAGQGPRALIAELVAGEVGRALGLPVPELVFVELDPLLGKGEPDWEIKALVEGSAGLNLGLDYLPGSVAYDPLARRGQEPPGADLAARVVWFDAYVTNPDRTPRNPNLLCWHRRLYLIDHGAALYFHHQWGDFLAQSASPFARIKDHVLLPLAGALEAADAELRPRLPRPLLEAIVDLIPTTWLDEPRFATAAAHRAAYVDYLLARRDAADLFVAEAARARAALGGGAG
jgi:hypothetical protein